MTSHRASSPAPRPPAVPTHYQRLELTPAATLQELRQAFRVLSKRYHPDTTSLPATEASEAFAQLRQAYAVLSDPDSRRAYDAELQRLRAAALQLSAAVPPLSAPAAPRPVGVRRSLSGGEWFALVLLALALVLSLVLGVGLAWARGVALITRPSWWSEPAVPTMPSPLPLSTPAECTPATVGSTPAAADNPARDDNPAAPSALSVAPASPGSQPSPAAQALPGSVPPLETHRPAWQAPEAPSSTAVLPERPTPAAPIPAEAPRPVSLPSQPLRPAAVEPRQDRPESLPPP